MSNELDLTKILREKTGVGMLDCRKALVEAGNDIEKAIEILRKKGIAIAAKRADNATNCGSVNAFMAKDNKSGTLVQMSCETDFSANTTDMRTFAINVAQAATEGSQIYTETTVMDLQLPEKNLSVKQGLEELISKIAENIKVQRMAHYVAPTNGVINSYIHPDHSIGVMIELETGKELASSEKERALQAARDVCMHVAVMNPVALDSTGLNPELIAKEKDVISEQLKATGKPAAIVDKIAEGKLAKYFEDVCLVNQKFVKNDKLSIQEYVNSVAKELGTTLRITRFTRLAIGR